MYFSHHIKNSTAGKRAKARKSSESHDFTQAGTILVTLLVFVVVGTIITAGATTVSLITTQGTSELTRGEEVFRIAEAGVENAILRILRDPSYTGETLTVGNGTATITVTGSGTLTIVSEGVLGDLRRKVQVVGTLSSNAFSITSWAEVD